jgi:hypothetical protein
MLITNFAAGELAETLFGRIDLPQYFQGVSRLENFDVIPAGGVSRRGGMKRLARLEGGEGRIIPFLTDRQNHCLLFLVPGKLYVYRNGTQKGPLTSIDEKPLYGAPGEIWEVQYAQNYNTMVLAHQNYPPLVVTIRADGDLSFARFYPDLDVEVVAGDDPGISMRYERDMTYVEGGYLSQTGNYPACVTFFQGRLVFANTAKARQRLFFSKVNEISRFSTYKLFLTEKQDYIAVSGTIHNASRVVELRDLAEGSRFVKKLSEYYINSQFFNPATRIESLVGKTLTLTQGAEVSYQLNPGEKTAVEAWKQAADEKENNPLVLTIGLASPSIVGKFAYVSATIGVTFVTLKETREGHEETVYFNENNVITNNNDAQAFLSDLGTRVLKYVNDTYVMIQPDYDNIPFNFIKAAQTMVGNAENYFQKVVRGKTFRGTPEAIYAEINIYYYADGSSVSIPFYTREIIEDRHPTAEDGFTFEIASDMNDAIRWVAQNKSLLAGTETGEWVIPAGTTAVNIQAILNSRYGSDAIQATSVGDALCFFQSGKKGLVEYYIPQQDNNFRANNMALLNKNMLQESPAADFDFVSAPCTRLFVCREDGVVAVLLYERATGTFAWGRVVTAGRILSVATFPGESGFDEAYLVVERNGRVFLELLDGQEQAYLDSYREWDNDTTGYDISAVIYDETDQKSWPMISAPQRNPQHRMWIGYPYASRMRSMPVLANDQMKENIIKALYIRFNGSFMPRVKAGPDGPEEHIPRDGPFSGIVKVPFPGSYERDVFFELTHDGPTPCRVLAINAEAQ